jgi:hypothetical protein
MYCLWSHVGVIVSQIEQNPENLAACPSESMSVKEGMLCISNLKIPSLSLSLFLSVS